MQLLTVPQAAKRLGLSRQRVHALVKSGAIRADMVGRDGLISQAELAAFLALPRKRGRPKGRGNRPGVKTSTD
jgi:excisionase family DNA binding protein